MMNNEVRVILQRASTCSEFLN